jgi:hypothetical protein
VLSDFSDEDEATEIAGMDVECTLVKPPGLVDSVTRVRALLEILG